VKTASRFRLLHDPELDPEHRITFSWNGTPIEAGDGVNLAAALLANGVTEFRNTAKSGEPRGPFCMMGSCFECLVTIDGAPNRQACMTLARQNMSVETGRPFPEIADGRSGGDDDDD